MVRLGTLGRIELVDGSGTPVEPILSRPRRVALLVYLAVEGRGRMLRREALLPVFWPEMDQQRARAALRQSLYVLRAALGEDVLITRGAEEVGVGEALLCDALQLDSAANAGNHDEVSRLYAGAFLHGFFIPEAPEFERWVEGQRDRIRRLAADSERAIARVEESGGNLTAAAERYRRTLALEPTDETALRALMETLEGSGDRAAALRAHAEFVEQLKRDYDLDPSAEINALAASIRERGTTGDSGARVSPVPTLSAGGESFAPFAHGRPLRRWSRRHTVSAIVAALVVATGVTIAATARKDEDVQRLVVMPFTVRGASDLSYLSEGMADMLSTSLDGPELYRTVPPAAVLRALRGGPASDDPQAIGRATAERFDAKYFVVGSVVASGRRIRLEAHLFGDGAEPVARALSEGDADSIFVLVDRVTARLIAESRGNEPAQRLRGSAALTTTSLVALREYLNGERALREGSYPAAESFFAKAIENDTTFGLAYYRLSMAANGQGDQRVALDNAYAADRHAQRLSTRDRALVAAHLAMLRGLADTAEFQFTEILEKTPDDVEAWLKKGEILFHNNSKRSRPIAEARAPFFRVLGYDPENRTSLLHLARLAAGAGDIVELDSIIRRYEALGINEGVFAMRALSASAHRDGAALSALLADAARIPDDAFVEAARDVLMFGGDAESAYRILEPNLAPARSPERREMTHLQLAMMDLAGGRLKDADRRLRSACETGICPNIDEWRAFYLINGFPLGDSAEIARLRTVLANPSPAGSGNNPRIPLNVAIEAVRPVVRASLASGLSLLSGDTAAAVRWARRIDSLPVGPDRAPVRKSLSMIARARIALAQNRASEAYAIVTSSPEIDAEPLGNLPWYAERRLVTAAAAEAAGQWQVAVRMLGSFEHQSLFYNPFVAQSAFRAGTLLDRNGERAAAARQYQTAARWWRDPDPVIQPLADRARARQAELAKQ